MEVMIAMAILAISLVAVFQSQSQSISMAGEARFLTRASLLAQKKMAEIEAMEPRQIANSSGDFGSQFPDYLWRLELTDTPLQYLKKLNVVVTNKRLAANNEYQLELYKFIEQ